MHLKGKGGSPLHGHVRDCGVLLSPLLAVCSSCTTLQSVFHSRINSAFIMHVLAAHSACTSWQCIQHARVAVYSSNTCLQAPQSSEGSTPSPTLGRAPPLATMPTGIQDPVRTSLPHSQVETQTRLWLVPNNLAPHFHVPRDPTQSSTLRQRHCW